MNLIQKLSRLKSQVFLQLLQSFLLTELMNFLDEPTVPSSSTTKNGKYSCDLSLVKLLIGSFQLKMNARAATELQFLVSS
jgi:hypothetical protein